MVGVVGSNPISPTNLSLSSPSTRRLDGVMLMNDTSLYALASFMVDVLSRLEPCPYAPLSE